MTPARSTDSALVAASLICAVISALRWPVSAWSLMQWNDQLLIGNLFLRSLCLVFGCCRPSGMTGEVMLSPREVGALISPAPLCASLMNSRSETIIFSLPRVIMARVGALLKAPLPVDSRQQWLRQRASNTEQCVLSGSGVQSNSQRRPRLIPL